ncbi:MAG: S-formylglutathione hydrolase FrmB [Pirellulaceae bacterium]|jgi:S-formylglutathione hydrolase FrmB
MIASSSQRCLVTVLLLVIASTESNAQSKWVKKPSQELLDTTPGLLHETFESDSMKTTVGYSVVLPPSYKTGTQRYPVVYWLHGGGGNECSSLYTAKSWLELYEKKQASEVILVYPSAFRSGYMDHHDGTIMVESMIIRELIPRIDARFRTIPTRAGRAAHGFSMGSSGSLKFVFKYPQLFCAAVAYGGGAVDLANTKSKFILDILQRNLNSDAELIRQNNTYHYLEKNQEVTRQNGLEILLICGADDSWRESAETFLAALQKSKIPCQLKLVPKVGHSLRGMTAAEGVAAAMFQDRMFRAAP